MWDWNDGHMNDGWSVAMTLGMLGIGLVLLTGVLVAVVWAVRSAGASTAGLGAATPGESGAPGVPGDAHRILAERLARGEIDADEYRARLEALDGHATPSRP